ncbi:MAG: VOC family protein [Anaerolineae bacterium]|nr:VOC family protein [Anaerolineae bacterium]
MIREKGIFRMMLVAKDYAASIAFYRDALGLAVDHDWYYGPKDCGTVFTAGAGLVEILGALPGMEYAVPQGAWLAMEVDDVDAAYQALLQKSVNILEAPTTYPWGHRIMKLTDPDGLLIWLFSPAAKAS